MLEKNNKMTKRQVLVVNNVLKSIEGLKLGKKFSYAVLKNKRKIKSEVDILDEVRKPSKEYIEYTSEMSSLQKRFAKKDEDGNIKFNKDKNGNVTDYFTIDITDEYVKLAKEVNEKYKDAIDEHQKNLEEFESILNEEIDTPEFYKIDFELIPEDFTALDIENVSFMLEE